MRKSLEVVKISVSATVNFYWTRNPIIKSKSKNKDFHTNIHKEKNKLEKLNVR